MISSYSATRDPTVPVNQAAKRSCSRARVRLSRRAYAVSRTRIWLKWKSSASPGSARRMSCLRHSAASARSRSASATLSSMSTDSALVENSRPITEADSTTLSSVDPRRSRRAPSKDKTFPGTERTSAAPEKTQRPACSRRRPSSISMDSICSMNSGLPSARPRILRSSALGRLASPSRSRTTRPLSVRESSARSTWDAVRRPAAKPAGPRGARGGPRRGGGAARRARRRGCPR